MRFKEIDDRKGDLRKGINSHGDHQNFMETVASILDSGQYDGAGQRQRQNQEQNTDNCGCRGSIMFRCSDEKAKNA